MLSRELYSDVSVALAIAGGRILQPPYPVWPNPTQDPELPVGSTSVWSFLNPVWCCCHFESHCCPTGRAGSQKCQQTMLSALCSSKISVLAYKYKQMWFTEWRTWHCSHGRNSAEGGFPTAVPACSAVGAGAQGQGLAMASRHRAMAAAVGLHGPPRYWGGAFVWGCASQVSVWQGPGVFSMCSWGWRWLLQL